MSIDFKCPHCGDAMQVDQRFAGTSGPCRKCGQTITIPGSAAAQTVVTPRQGPGSGVIIIAMVIAAVGMLAILVLVALLLPAVNAAREAARRNGCINNVRQLTVAMASYEASNGTLPPAYTVDENGNRLHSWRVLILPYIDQAQLYDSLDLTKPWDHPVNAPLLEQTPTCYRCPSARDPSSQTNYLVVVGPETAFPGSDPVATDELTDGAARTALIVEAEGKGVHWASPDDIAADQFDNAHGGHHHGGFIVGFADRHVEFVADDVTDDERRAMITRAGAD